jgi:hypothetical protein
VRFAKAQEGSVIENTLQTMNVWLAITVVVSAVEALAVIALVIGGYLVYRRVMAVAAGLELGQVAPLMSRLRAILEDVNDVTARVRGRTARVDRAISGAVGLVAYTGRRVEKNLGSSARGGLAVLIGVLAAFAAILKSRNEDAAGARPPT